MAALTLVSSYKLLYEKVIFATKLSYKIELQGIITPPTICAKVYISLKRV